MQRRHPRRAQPGAHPLPQLVGVDVADSTTDAPMSSPHSCDGMAYDGDVVDGGVLAQHVLDLAGRDVLAAAHDDVVEAALDEQEPVGVEEAAVAGGEPVAAALAADVLTRHLLAAHPDLAGLARRRPPRRTGRGSTARSPPTAGRPSPAAGARPDRRWPSASRWSSGVSTAIVELVSVSP